jgi:hypothetical protein
VSWDDPAEPQQPARLVCDILINGGVELVLNFIENELQELKNQDDYSAALLCSFIQGSRYKNKIKDEYLAPIFKAIDEDLDFVYDFKTRTRKILLDYFSQKLQAVSMENLMKKLNGMTIER